MATSIDGMYKIWASQRHQSGSEQLDGKKTNNCPDLLDSNIARQKSLTHKNKRAIAQLDKKLKTFVENSIISSSEIVFTTLSSASLKMFEV